MNPHLRVTMIQADLAWQDPAANRAQFARALPRARRAHRPHRAAGDVHDRLHDGGRGARRDHGRPDGRAGCARRPSRSAARSPAASSSGTANATTTGCSGRTPDGRLQHYDKRHLFRMAGEQRALRRRRPRGWSSSIKGWRICPLVCYDLRFPVWSRNRGDYDLLLYVANWPARRSVAWTDAAARAGDREPVLRRRRESHRQGRQRRDLRGRQRRASISSARRWRGDRGGDFVETVVLDRESLASLPQRLPGAARRRRFRARPTGESR